jgi:glucosamine--fructose-6-phosphate aminotransferase (isomerizing)
MCGIVGYIGSQDALPVLLEGLEKLEYRGYDSSGVALIEGGKLVVTRALGKLKALRDKFATRSGVRASVGIGHTRWATHGRPSERNAHPHTAGRVSIIHNGIIENYAELREELKRGGSQFSSDTDTEVAAHLLDRALKQGHAPLDALSMVCAQIRGSYAFVAIDEQNPDRLLVAKNATTPIVIGMAQGEYIVSSDVTGLLHITRDVIFLEDGDLAEITKDSLRIVHQGVPEERKMQRITWDPVTAQKGGYKHFMLKEIFEQPQVFSEVVRGRLDLDGAGIALSDLPLTSADVRAADRIVLVACGTAWHSCLVAQFYIEQIARIPVTVDYASEYRYRSPVLTPNTIVIAVSQSGETADTIAAIEVAARHAKTFAVCNVVGATLTRKVQGTLFTNAGPEISVASTKAFTTQLLALYLFAIHLGALRGAVTDGDARELARPLLTLPGVYSETLEVHNQVEQVAKKLASARDFIFLGRGSAYPIALEGALKLKELAYIHAEGYPAGEMKHGPLALIDENVPVVVLLPRSQVLFEKTLSNLKEVESRGGRIIAVTDSDKIDQLHGCAESIISLPFVSDFLSPVIMTLPMQLLAYYVAVFNGTDVDQPRNLAKSVTVE